jgi:hypothetical protein
MILNYSKIAERINSRFYCFSFRVLLIGFIPSRTSWPGVILKVVQ